MHEKFDKDIKYRALTDKNLVLCELPTKKNMLQKRTLNLKISSVGTVFFQIDKWVIDKV